jgi:uncharacterized protein (UPF0276 family)
MSQIKSSVMDLNSNGGFFGGVGLRPPHYLHLLQKPQTTVSFFEIISENFMNTQGRPLWVVDQIRQDYPFLIHGVGMGIGGYDPLDRSYFDRLLRLIDRIQPIRVSDHFCWTSAGGHYSHDLLPMSYNQDMLDHLIPRVNQAQEWLGRQLLLENASAYLKYKNSDIPEWEFIVEVANQTGCGLLLDLNNIFVNARIFGFDPKVYLDHIPSHLIGQVHLAGFTDQGTHYFDTHSKSVHDGVWALLHRLAERPEWATLPQVPVMIEWDEDIPAFSELEQELGKARQIWVSAQRRQTSIPEPELR